MLGVKEVLSEQVLLKWARPCQGSHCVRPMEMVKPSLGQVQRNEGFPWCKYECWHFMLKLLSSVMTPTWHCSLTEISYRDLLHASSFTLCIINELTFEATVAASLSECIDLSKPSFSVRVFAVSSFPVTPGRANLKLYRSILKHM